MFVLNARNANQALPEMMHLLERHPDVVQRDSRNGPVRLFDTPMTIRYQKPRERVVFWQERDANPFFHLFESLWMLAGRNDVAYPARFSSNIQQFSDDGSTFHGAYGYRWRYHFKIDQLGVIAKALKSNPDDRRCVLDMWDSAIDLGRSGKDVPCNIVAVFNRDSRGLLNMTVYNRSNDVVWGALGANCVHFSYLQEFLASWIGCDVGQYWQVSSNMHAYLELSPAYTKCRPLGDKAFPGRAYKHECPYELDQVDPFPLVSIGAEAWQSELDMFLSEGGRAMGYKDPFFRRIAIPMDNAYRRFKDRENPDRFGAALEALVPMASSDWKLACVDWVHRRKDNAAALAKRAAQAA